MRKLLLALLATASTIATVGLTAGPAAALGGEQLGCYITPTPPPAQYHARSCSDGPGSTYSAAFGVMNGNGTYSYAWSVPAAYTSHIASGCTADTPRCVLSNLTPTSEITVSVTITQNGQSATLSATAYINQWCGQISCI
jgi:hypothetical protein